MKIIPCTIPELVLLEPPKWPDERGWFKECFNLKHFHQQLTSTGQSPPKQFVQDNLSYSKKGVIRGLHYQIPPHAQGKLIQVIQGAIYDVVVDIRQDSPTFGHWEGVELSAENHRMFWVPPGFAHGFLAIEASYVLYKVTDYYCPESERSIHWASPALNISWPYTETPSLNLTDEAAAFFE